MPPWRRELPASSTRIGEGRPGERHRHGRGGACSMRDEPAGIVTHAPNKSLPVTATGCGRRPSCRCCARTCIRGRVGSGQGHRLVGQVVLALEEPGPPIEPAPGEHELAGPAGAHGRNRADVVPSSSVSRDRDGGGEALVSL
jgi:hypothetical protein